MASAPSTSSTSAQRNFVVAVDASPAASLAMRWAADWLCRAQTDTIHLVHVHRPPEVTASDMAHYVPTAADIQRERQFHTDVLNDTVAKFKAMAGGRCQCQGHLVAGDAREAIIAAADKAKAEVVVVGSRGLSPVARALLGSVSSYLVMHCPQPVVVIKPPQH
eukprot:m.44051 g.44051  ORF g.44051 m.44051 type:complete len:163 (-) comp5810_c0_seq2:222-710(-)